MKIIKKIIACVVLAIFTQSAMARHKDQIFFTNNYGQDVSILINWKNKSYPGDQNIMQTIKKNAQGIMIKAPYSSAHLSEIIVVPTKNIPGIVGLNTAAITGTLGGASATAVGMATANPALMAAGGVAIAGSALLVHMLKAENNHHIKNAHGHSFFVIEKMDKKSEVKGQNKIAIRGYDSAEQYKKETGKEIETQAAPEIMVNYLIDDVEKLLTAQDEDDQNRLMHTQIIFDEDNQEDNQNEKKEDDLFYSDEVIVQARKKGSCTSSSQCYSGYKCCSGKCYVATSAAYGACLNASK